MAVRRPATRPAGARAGGTGEPAGGGRTPGGNRGVLATNLIITVVLVVAVGAAAILLARTVSVAKRIDTKAQNIAKSGKGINASTDSIVQLKRTNSLASSILRHTSPLDDQLTSVVGRASSIRNVAGSINNRAAGINSTAGRINASATDINGSASSINASTGAILSSASAINGTAGRISRTARSINGIAGTIGVSARSINSTAGGRNGILRVARLIDRDALNINTNLDQTINLAKLVKVDTGNILNQAGRANDTAACIAQRLPPNGAIPDCKGAP